MREAPSPGLMLLLAVVAGVVGGAAVGLITGDEDVGIDDDPESAQNRVEVLDERIDRLASELEKTRGASTTDRRVDELAARVARLERANVATPSRSEPPPQPASAGNVGPRAEDPVTAEDDVTYWIKKLGGQADDAVGAAAELGRLGDARAVPPLTKALRGHRDSQVRAGAASALGQLEALDAVRDLIEALGDKDADVRTAAHEALVATTGHGDVPFMSSDPVEDRKEAQAAWRAWWSENEKSLRESR